MADLRSECGVIVAKALNIFINNKGLEAPEVEASSLLLETPPNPEMGDVGIPLFAFAKTLRMGPPVIASELVKIIEADLSEEIEYPLIFGFLRKFENLISMWKIKNQEDLQQVFYFEANPPQITENVIEEINRVKAQRLENL